MTLLNLTMISTSLSCFLAIHLWLVKKNKFITKSYWTIVMFIPFLGIMVYLAFYDPPSVLPNEIIERKKKDSIYPNHGNFGRSWK